MPEYDNTNSGALFPNDRRETERHPNLTGTLNVGGVDHYLSGWTKVSKNGKKFISLSLGKPKGQVAPQRSAAPEAQGFSEEIDDEIPFS